VVAIGGNLYCHDKYLVARGSLSIATLNIVVAIGGTLYCHDKCLVARGCLYNTLVLSMHLALAFHEHKHHPSIHEHEHVKFHFIHLLFNTCDVAYILTYACDHV